MKTSEAGSSESASFALWLHYPAQREATHDRRGFSEEQPWRFDLPRRSTLILNRREVSFCKSRLSSPAILEDTGIAVVRRDSIVCALGISVLGTARFRHS